ncbi:MAG: energy transducer TonB [Gammaproteobacteria bacterium]|nr:energy transducer TonB [Gammaproteobacteria bacterium]
MRITLSILLLLPALLLAGCGSGGIKPDEIPADLTMTSFKGEEPDDEKPLPACKIVQTAESYYPTVAENNCLSGKVTMEVDVNWDGSVANMTFLLEQPERIFTRPARRAIKGYLFDTTVVDGEPHPMSCIVTIDFQPPADSC